MKIRFTRTVGLLVLCMGLGACSWFNGSDGMGVETGSQSASSAESSGAQAYGLGGSDSFSAENGFVDGKPTNQTYYFGFDTNHVQAQYDKNLSAQAAYLVEHPNVHVRLEGNTDERGSREYNIALGERRALSVEKVLEMQGVPKKQIILVSYGAEKPAVLGHQESAYHLNRRVNLKYQG